MTRSKHRLLIIGWLASVALLAASLHPSVNSAPAASLSISITEPDGVSDMVGEGDDYATVVLGDPWDMDQRYDIRWTEGLGSITATGGTWQGVATTDDPYLFVPFQGLAGAANLGRLGVNYPIDTGKYTQLSFRMRTSHPPAYMEIYWYATVSGDNWWIPAGQHVITESASVQPYEWHIYSLDLTIPPLNPEVWPGQWQDAPLAYGIRIDPASLSGATAEVDWVRLTDPTASPTYTVQWAYSDASPGAAVTLYYDTDPGGYDGYLIASGISATLESYDWRPAFLAPGDYYLYARIEDGGGPVSSDYNGPLTINASPTLRFTAPSMASGADYGAEVVGDTWDMSSPSDISFTYQMAQVNYDGWLNATTAGNDAHFHPRLTTPIDAHAYRYLTYRLWVEGTQDVPGGWISRVVYWDSGLFEDGSETEDIVVYEGWNTYQMDLSQVPTDAESGLPAPGWSGTKSVLRFDPLEVTNPTRFHVDYMTLTGDDTADASYTVRWEMMSSQDDDTTIRLYRDLDNSGYDGTLIGEIHQNQSTSSGSFLWQTGCVPAGTYYPYAVADDGKNSWARYSDTPILVSHAVTDTTPPSSSVDPLDPNQEYTAFFVSWSGSDGEGGSGIWYYDVQYRDGLEGAWLDWKTGTSSTGAFFYGVGGHTYYFRSRAVDNACNAEQYPAPPDDYDAFTVAGFEPGGVHHLYLPLILKNH